MNNESDVLKSDISGCVEGFASLPFRVRSGRIDDKGIFFHTSNKSLSFLWDAVEFFSLGIIRSEVGLGKEPRSSVRNFVRSIIFGENEKVDKPKEFTESYLLDIFIKGETRAYRIDQALVNYRGFLAVPGFVSLVNFRNFLKRIVKFAGSVKITPAFSAFVENNRDKFIKYENVYEFEHASLDFKKDPSGLMICSDIKIAADEEEK